MRTFGVIAEGLTDQVVIENIIVGFFEADSEEPAIQYVQPPRPPSEAPGGWGHVFKSLQRKDHEAALQFNRYLVIHIDTDVQEEAGFDVPRRENGKELTVEERVSRVIEKIKGYIDVAFYEANKDRIIFAIAVDTIECWLLPLLYDGKKAAKVTGCLARQTVRSEKADEDALSAGEEKFVAAYEKASRRYRKRSTLVAFRGRNQSLELFVQRLDELEQAEAHKAPGPP